MTDLPIKKCYLCIIKKHHNSVQMFISLERQKDSHQFKISVLNNVITNFDKDEYNLKQLFPRENTSSNRELYYQIATIVRKIKHELKISINATILSCMMTQYIDINDTRYFIITDNDFEVATRVNLSKKPFYGLCKVYKFVDLRKFKEFVNFDNQMLNLLKCDRLYELLNN